MQRGRSFQAACAGEVSVPFQDLGMKPNCLLCFAFFVLVDVSVASTFASFDTAIASSVYTAGDTSVSPAFGAAQATIPGVGYWSSSGSHAVDDVVSWTGVLSATRKISGIRLVWAYSPGEYKLLVSTDGANFMEARPWETISRNEVSFTESIMFEPKYVKVVSVVMRHPRAWGYFGLSSAVVIAEPSPVMLVAGLTSSAT
jgi:hypothetical protein